CPYHRKRPRIRTRIRTRSARPADILALFTISAAQQFQNVRGEGDSYFASPKGSRAASYRRFLLDDLDLREGPLRTYVEALVRGEPIPEEYEDGPPRHFAN